MKSLRAAICTCLIMFGAAFSTGCIIVDEDRHHTETQCYDDCYDYEVCESYCDYYECWDECWWETECDTVCEDVVVYDEHLDHDDYSAPTPGNECYSDPDCNGDDICVANRCVAAGSDAKGLGGLCQACETNNDCIEDGALCIELSFDQATSTGELVCTRPCEYNHECPAGFECINISSEAGTSAQCLPVLTEWGERTCNPSPELECVRATDCGLGESCVANECIRPDGAPAPSDGSCVTRTDCNSGESCIDGQCLAAAENCVFNEECDGGACVDGTCLSTCNTDSDCASAEQCRAGLCEPAECRRTADCAAGNICVDARCEDTCDAATGAGCDGGYVCNNFGYCEADPNVECRTAAECARDEVCEAGSCTTACSCNQQCADGDVCNLNTGTCQGQDPGPVQCENDCDCPSGLMCSDGACI